MGDRNNPIKFGPEWLRNLSLEHNAGTSNNNSQNQTRSAFPNTTTAGAIPGTSTGNTAAGSSASNVPYSTQSTLAKVLLAKQRFGKEEMLALYDKDVEAPEELKQIEVLYQARGKPPIALNNTFDDDMRDNMRSGPSTSSGISPGERFSLNRGGLGRMNVTEARGRARLPFVRQMPSVRGGAAWHPRMPIYSGGPDEEPTMNVRSSWNNSNGGNAANATQNDHWTSKMFRSKRQGTPANWRQSRDEGEEWRAQDSARTRSNQQDQKRDWADRPQEKQSWSSNRRTWVGGDTQNNDDNLPEWAMDNAEACGGTFDSSGAFHGYSNDDSNLPKSHDAPYPLTRSNTTHGSTGPSFSASKSVDESSDEWWASEKAKKLSPKRFDASDIKFKKQMSLHEGNMDSNTDVKPFTIKGETHHETAEKNDPTNTTFTLEGPDPSTSACNEEKPKINTYQSTFSRVDSGEMLSDISFGETGDEKGNFQSVIISTPNNILRQKHQNIVPAASEASKTMESNMNRDNKQGILHLLQNAQTSHALENEMRKAQTPEKNLVDDFIDLTIDEKETSIKQKAIASPQNQPSANITSTLPLMGNSLSQIPTPSMQLGLSSPVFPNQGLGNPKQNIPTSGIPVGMPSSLQGLPAGLQLAMQMPAGMQIGGLPQSLQVTGMQHLNMQQSGMQPPGVQQSSMQQSNMQQSGMQQSNMQPSNLQQTGLQSSSIQPSGMQQTGMQTGIQQSTLQMSGNQQPGLQSGSGMHQSTMPISISTPGMQGGLQTSGMQSGLQGNMQSSMQPVGISNSALNASLGLTILNNQMGLPLQNVGTPVLGMSGMNSGIGGPNMQGGMSAGMQASNTGLPSFPNSGIPGMSNANVTNSSLFMGQNPNNGSMGNTSNNNIGMPNLAGQSNMFPMHGLQHSSSQGSFGSSIYSNMMQQAPNQQQPSQNMNDQWYYEDPAKNIQGPFMAKDMYNWYRAGFFSPNLMVRRACDAHMRPLGSYGPIVPFIQRDVLPGFSMSNNYDRSPHESLMNQQHALGLESVDSLWSQSSPEHWVQQALNNALSEPRANYYIWDQPSNIASNQMIPEDITKDMKTEDQILAQLRAAQNISSPQNVPFLSEQPVASPTTKKIEEPFASTPITVAKLEELQKLIQKDNLSKSFNDSISENIDVQPPKPEKHTIVEQPLESKIIQTKPVTDMKQPKPSKTDSEKASKNKENNNTKNKNKKKEEKKDDIESKIKEDDNTITEKRSEELSPTKSKKEDKVNKKELEKEKKEWLKDGFTIVKGSEKNVGKDNKKKIEEAKLAEEAERKRKEEEERLAAEEERKRKQAEILRKQELQQQKQQQRQAAESVVKKAPWSAVANQGMLSTSKDGLTLAEIQRLEREKKLEQMKEQQQMMQIIAQQQAAALAREQEMQAGLGWAKKKANMNVPSQSLAEIQAEARKQAAAAAAAAAAAVAEAAITQALDEGRPPPMNMPWANAPNGGGFWDTQPNQPPKVEKSLESPKPVEIKNKKKAPVNVPPKKETSPAAEFDTWCNTVLASWSSKIDVPTFVGFLKDIESPYEVKDYVKCYLGESKDTNDFARHFLERRSKLLRASTVTPSDDLCSPAMAINPRNTSNSDYQEGKGKKTKKNKMLKVDARILGFSVTASEDRINVGDIDTV